MIVIWEWTGYNMVILYTALRSVPRDVVEAAILDDTPLWKIILKVKLPMVRPAIVLLVFINTIGALQLFTEPQILRTSRPRPSRSTSRRRSTSTTPRSRAASTTWPRRPR